MRFNKFCYLAVFAGATSVTMVGCGGGGSDGDVGGNTPPVAFADSYQAVEGRTLSPSSVLDNDVDADGDTLTASLVTPPGQGTFQLFPDGTFEYTPASGAAIVAESFEYQASDGNSRSAAVKVLIEIDAAPVADAGSATQAPAGSTVTLDGSNSRDPNGGELVYAWSQVAGDPVALNGVTTPKPTFTAPAAAPQTLRFSLQVTDSIGLSGNATVDVVVNAAVAEGACENVEQDTAFAGNLNDLVDNPGALSLAFSPADPQPTSGQVAVNSDGSYTYTPNTEFRGGDQFGFEVESGSFVAKGVVDVIVGKTNVMPLGDSITVGITGNGAPEHAARVGYRAKLFKDLTDSGYAVDFVGGESNGSSAEPPIGDPDHQSYGGMEPEQVADGGGDALSSNDGNGTIVPDGITFWLNERRDAGTPVDVILLHIGTNDINTDVSNKTIMDVDLILDKIDIWETSNDNPITVFLARIIERTTVSTKPFMYNNPNVDEFNIKISELIESRAANPDKVIEVDQHAAIDDPVNDLQIDGIHPVPSAYEKMADKWLEAIVASNVIPVCESSAGP